MNPQETATGMPKYTKEQLDSVKFDPTNNYSWALETEFAFSGKEFEFLFNELLNMMNAPFSVQTSLKLMALYHTVETKFKQGLLDGKIKQLTPEQVQAAMETTEYEEVK